MLQTCTVRQRCQQLKGMELDACNYELIGAQVVLTNRSRCCSKSKLEEPANELIASSKASKEEAGVANKTFLGRISSSISKGIADGPKFYSNK